MPLKRSEALQPISRQHHNGLLFCLLLQKGLKKQADVAVMQEFIQWFWYNDLRQHFELEEICFLPLKDRFFQLVAGLEKMLADHYEIRNIINEVSISPGDSSIELLRDKLEKHIRFEERTLFPLIEETIPAAEQSSIRKISGEGKEANCMNYPTKFWE